MNKKKFDAKKILSILMSILMVASHIVAIVLFVKVFAYYSIYPNLFNYITIIVLCVFIMMDIVYFVGLKHMDQLQKIISSVMAILIIVVSVYGNIVMSKTTQLVDNIFETETSGDKYETVSGVFVTYNSKYANITDITEFKNKSEIKVGYLLETSIDSISSIGKEKLDQEGIEYSGKSFTNNTDLLFALIGGNIDVAIFSNVYEAIFRADENVDYTQYLQKMNAFSEFSRDILIESNASKKDLSKDPFNVLLIGWSPIIGSTTVGLADAIIVATVNPQTYTVSMMSIARDSYVPISCYGGECDKINSGRGTSMDCFVSTVENLIGEEIDFYMEINFYGFAELCGQLGGIEINNPVSFTLDGVYVPAGNYVADGWQALQFARERHHMPNGDFDRQQHQKEVIMEIAKKFLKHDLTFALDTFNTISDSLNTNMTFEQIAGVFNMLKSTKNYTGLSIFNMLDMHALRITGYADWHYSDEYELPLWIYRLYNGSVSESLEHMQEVLGNYKTITQDSGFSFSSDAVYVRSAFYSTEYNEVETHEVLPPYYINLTSMTYKEVVEWAKTNGVTLKVNFIYSTDAAYDESLDGMVISQSVAYGKKISKYPTCEITVMGNGKRKAEYPDNYKGMDLDEVLSWCEENEFPYKKEVSYISKDNSEGYKNNQVYKMKYDEEEDIMYVKYYKVCGDNSSPNSKGDGCACNTNYKDDGTGTCKLFVTVPTDLTSIITSCKAASNKTYTSTGTDKLVYKLVEEYSRTKASGEIISVSPEKGSNVAQGSTVTITISKGVNPDEKQVPNVVGKTATEAKTAIEAAGLVYATDDGQYSTTTKDTVLAQSKAKDEWVAKGTTITVTLSKGQKECGSDEVKDGNGGCALKATCTDHQTYDEATNTCKWDEGYAEGGCAEGYIVPDGKTTCELKASYNDDEEWQSDNTCKLKETS